MLLLSVDEKLLFRSEYKLHIAVWDGKLCMAMTKSDKRHSRTKSWENFTYNPSYFSCKNFIMSLKPGRPWELYFTQQISQLQKIYEILLTLAACDDVPSIRRNRNNPENECSDETNCTAEKHSSLKVISLQFLIDLRMPPMLGRRCVWFTTRMMVILYAQWGLMSILHRSFFSSFNQLINFLFYNAVKINKRYNARSRKSLPCCHKSRYNHIKLLLFMRQIEENCSLFFSLFSRSHFLNCPTLKNSAHKINSFVFVLTHRAQQNRVNIFRKKKKSRCSTFWLSTLSQLHRFQIFFGCFQLMFNWFCSLVALRAWICNESIHAYDLCEHISKHEKNPEIPTTNRETIKRK